MECTTVAVDLAKDVIEVAAADRSGNVGSRQRLSRAAFSRYLLKLPTCQIVMEACSGAHHWARLAMSHGHKVKLMPAQYVGAYRRRNKTDRADCMAILEAAKNNEILPVPVKRPDQQALQALHRLRSQWMATRTARINTLRGLLRELGVVIPMGAATAIKQFPEAIDHQNVPPFLRPGLQSMLEEIRQLEHRTVQAERDLAAMTRHDPAVQILQKVSGIGLLTSTALVASAGDARHFRSGRYFASWLGLTPREHSSGNTRRLGGISKRGDSYVRMLLIHGARSVMLRAKQQLRSGRPLNRLQQWAVDLDGRVGHNKAATGLANKIARIAWACWMHGTDFNGNHAVA
ncbi:MAG: family transposase [Hydrocarboniphaga sp.]|uniref:IS110 family transposase n=1 Tax=Hydrocarboniphaga sp. TaxID=2033016 RepID=UPI0026182565|nr:IS110 family transposase [Hydrocarboniphaga sp.]MDB5970213.1 family transposase [Hydrocarboniphaga sp.]